MVAFKYCIQFIKGLCLAMLLLVAPGCCWGGCLEKCKPCAPCKPCKQCDDSCVVKEPRKSNRSYQKNITEQEEDDDIEIVELENEV